MQPGKGSIEIYSRYKLAHGSDRGLCLKYAEACAECGADRAVHERFCEEEHDNVIICRAEGPQDAYLFFTMHNGDGDGIVDDVHADEYYDKPCQAEGLLEPGDQELDLFCPACRGFDAVSFRKGRLNAFFHGLKIGAPQQAYVNAVNSAFPAECLLCSEDVHDCHV